MIVGKPLINGTEYSHADITMEIQGFPHPSLTNIEYGDPQDITLNYGTGQHPVSRTYGQVKPVASITLSKKEVERLTAAAPGNRIQNIPALDIGVNYLTEAGDFVRHTLLQARFTGRSVSSQTGNSQLEEKLELSIAGIKWK
jgi:hypothetical protein